MKVSLINWTHDALNLLLSTKNTRLGYESDPEAWSEEERAAHLRYMLGTIKSSWEFVDYTFRISGVTRAFTHQLVRTRNGSYAQESQRTVAVDSSQVAKPDRIEEDPLWSKQWDATIISIDQGYLALTQGGAPVQDARGLLPTNIKTNIVAKFSLRTLHEMAKVRLCTRTQGEYQDIFRAMRACVLRIHPWAEPFIRVACAADGVCCFPNYTECPIKPGIFDPDSGGVYGSDGEPGKHRSLNRPLTKEEIQARWESERHEAIPIAVKGTTMGPKS